MFALGPTLTSFIHGKYYEYYYEYEYYYDFFLQTIVDPF